MGFVWLSRRVVIASLLLLAAIACRAEAIASQLNLSWVDNSTNEVGFSIERSTGSTGTFAEITTMGPGVAAYTDSSVLDATTYCYRVRAFNTAGYSDYSNVGCASTAQAFGLAVLKMGSGSGTVTSTPAGITCGATCSGTYASGTAVTLTATPAAGSTFTGWNGGGCSGTGTCTVTLTATTTVTATFDLQPVTLTVAKAGIGSGTVSSAPAGISCGATCSASYSSGTAVSLTATPAAGSTFTGWNGGGCSVTGTCTVTLTATTTVTATFALQSVTLTVGKAGTGSGTVSSTPAGITCGGTCSASYTSGTGVALTGTPATGSTFTGWSGGTCSGTGTCNMTLTAATTVTATFTSAAGDTTPPTIAITTPIAGGAYTTNTSPLTLGGTADDNVGVTQVSWVNNRGGSGTASGTTSWSASGIALQSGTNVLTVTARDAAGNSATATLTVTYDATAPTVSITAPATGATVSGTTPVTASASDNVAVVGVQFLLDGSALGAEQTGPFSVSWNTTSVANGAHTLSARARDAAGNTAMAADVPVTVSNPQPSGLVAAYAFNEGSGTTVADASGNNNTGTVSGATWTTQGKFGNALVFNGTSALVTISDSSSLRLTTAMTLEAWVNPSTVTSGWRDAIYKGNDNYYLSASSDRTAVPAGGGTLVGGVYGLQALPANTWTHLALTYDGAALRLYVNGVQVASTQTTGSFETSANPLQIGGDSIYGQYFQGLIDEVRVYNRALAQAEIQTDMNNPIGATPPPDTTAPTIAITAPTAGPTYSTNTSPLALSGTAADNVGVTQVSWANDRGGSGTASGTTDWSASGIALQPGTNVLTITARDLAGNTGSATLTVSLQTVTLAVSNTGTGSGTVTSTPAGITCGATCSASYSSGTAVTLTATPAADSTFTGWSGGGGCSGTGACTVTLTATTTVTATFSLQSVILKVGKAGTGSGTVSSTPAGITCGATCSATYAAGTAVTLSATPASGSSFTGWSGSGCSGSGTCTVIVSATTTVTATFALQSVTLTVAEAGSGSGTVTSAPAGINCGQTCSVSYPSGTTVTLTATPTTSSTLLTNLTDNTTTAGSIFTGWSGGGCSGTGTCTVTLAGATTVTATFALQSFSLTVSKAGTGAGTVTSTPAGISCGATCSAIYPGGSVVTLTASAGKSSSFSGWSGGGCTGTSACTVTLNAAITVTATFGRGGHK